MSMNDFQLNELNHEDTHMELRAEGLVKRYGKRTVGTMSLSTFARGRLWGC